MGDSLFYYLHKYKRYIEFLANKKSFDKFFKDDLISIGKLSIIRSLQTYDVTKGTLDSHIKANINYEMQRWMIQNKNSIRTPNNKRNDPLQTVSLDMPLEEDLFLSDTLCQEEEDLSLNDLELTQNTKLKQSLASLSTRQQRILYLRFTEDLSLEEIGEKLKTSKESIRQSLENILDRIRNALK